MNTVKETLIAARELISDPARWTKDVFALDDRGIQCEWSNPRAVCFCAEGAIARHAHTFTEMGRVWEHMKTLIPKHCELYRFNDASETTHADVLALFDRAIAACDNA